MFEDAKRFVNKHFTFDLCYAIFSTQIHWSEASIRKILFETIRATFDIRNLKTLNNIINVHFAARNPSKHLIFCSAKKKGCRRNFSSKSIFLRSLQQTIRLSFESKISYNSFNYKMAVLCIIQVRGKHSLLNQFCHHNIHATLSWTVNVFPSETSPI